MTHPYIVRLELEARNATTEGGDGTTSTTAGEANSPNSRTKAAAIPSVNATSSGSEVKTDSTKR